jgi:hypothetical protein
MLRRSTIFHLGNRREQARQGVGGWTPQSLLSLMHPVQRTCRWEACIVWQRAGELGLDTQRTLVVVVVVTCGQQRLNAYATAMATAPAVLEGKQGGRQKREGKKSTRLGNGSGTQHRGRMMHTWECLSAAAEAALGGRATWGRTWRQPATYLWTRRMGLSCPVHAAGRVTYGEREKFHSRVFARVVFEDHT